jgi:hypothetical protein
MIQICVMGAKRLLPITRDNADIRSKQKREPPQHCDEHLDTLAD